MRRRLNRAEAITAALDAETPDIEHRSSIQRFFENPDLTGELEKYLGPLAFTQLLYANSHISRLDSQSMQNERNVLRLLHRLIADSEHFDWQQSTVVAVMKAIQNDRLLLQLSNHKRIQLVNSLKPALRFAAIQIQPILQEVMLVPEQRNRMRKLRLEILYLLLAPLASLILIATLGWIGAGFSVIPEILKMMFLHPIFAGLMLIGFYATVSVFYENMAIKFGATQLDQAIHARELIFETPRLVAHFEQYRPILKWLMPIAHLMLGLKLIDNWPLPETTPLQDVQAWVVIRMLYVVSGFLSVKALESLTHMPQLLGIGAVRVRPSISPNESMNLLVNDRTILTIASSNINWRVPANSLPAENAGQASTINIELRR